MLQKRAEVSGTCRLRTQVTVKPAIRLAFPFADCLLAALAATILLPLVKRRTPQGGFGLKRERGTA